MLSNCDFARVVLGEVELGLRYPIIFYLMPQKYVCSIDWQSDFKQARYLFHELAGHVEKASESA